jgi:hypothetical protein
MARRSGLDPTRRERGDAGWAVRPRPGETERNGSAPRPWIRTVRRVPSAGGRYTADTSLGGPGEPAAPVRREPIREENASSQTSSSIRIRLADADAGVRAIVNVPLSAAYGVS